MTIEAMPSDPATGSKIKRARERLRWTQQQLADALEVDRKTVNNWETGKTSPKSSIGALEHVLGVRLDDEPGSDVVYERTRERLRQTLDEELPPDEADRMKAIIDAALEGRIPPRRRDSPRRAEAG